MFLVDISVVIVNFNGAKFIEACLDSLFASELSYTYDVWMVDNASTDNSLEILSGYKDCLNLIVNTENTGFSYANNQAIRACSGRYLFILNNDTVLEKNTIQLLMHEHERTPNLGVICPKLLNADGSLQCPGSSFGHWRFKQNRVRFVPFIAGAAFLMRKSVMDEMGGMDENLFFYNDDIDMCRFLRHRGYPILYFPEAKVVHFGGLSTQYRKVGSLIEGYRGGIYLAYKHYGFIAGVLYRVVLCLDLFVRLLLSFGNRDMFGGYLQVLWINVTNDIYLSRIKKENRL
ncbi:MAG: glycosyltransferase family 2 protein [Candidatus Margulisbacteria bacterium]|nr:glycosyltransferase family 2 protein [Candidatus Margulisiibacteriota bacterium]